MQGQDAQTVMPKFILYSAHAETIFPIMRDFSYFADFGAFHPNAASMFFVNFYECASCEGEDKFSAEVSFYPHEYDQDDKDQLQQVANLTLTGLSQWIEFTIAMYLQQYGLDTGDEAKLCEEDYEEQYYWNPEEYRTMLYEKFDFNPEQKDKFIAQ